MNQSDLEIQILKLLDGELDRAAAATLERALLADPGAMETYQAMVQLHNALETRYLAGTTVDQMTVVPVDRIISRQRRRIIKGSLLAAAAILLVSAITMWMILAPHRPVSVGSFRTAPDSLFFLTYEGEGDHPSGSQLVVGSRIRLTEGTLEGAFENGVRLVAEAPCQLRVLTKDRVALDNGRAWFEVPKPAAGFAVETSELVAIDLGTEFGVVSSSFQPDQVHVIDGRVEVRSRTDGGAQKILEAGDACRTAPDGQLPGAPFDASHFRTNLTQTRSITIANHSFEQDVLPRDGDPSTQLTGKDDYNKNTTPSGWERFDDGDGGTSGTQGILSTAEDSAFHKSLDRTPDADANDQLYYSSARDLFQVLEEPLQPNSTYTLKVDIGDRDHIGSLGNPGNPGIRLGSGTIPGEKLLQPTHTHFPAQLDGGWVTWTITFKTGPEPENAGEPLRIELTSGSQVGWFDNVRMTVTR